MTTEARRDQQPCRGGHDVLERSADRGARRGAVAVLAVEEVEVDVIAPRQRERACIFLQPNMHVYGGVVGTEAAVEVPDLANGWDPGEDVDDDDVAVATQRRPRAEHGVVGVGRQDDAGSRLVVSHRHIVASGCGTRVTYAASA